MATISNYPQSKEEPKKHEFDNGEEEEEEEENEDEELEGWDDWEAEDEAAEDGDDEEGSDSNLLCLFCNSRYCSCNALFDHYISSHHFGFSRGSDKAGFGFLHWV